MFAGDFSSIGCDLKLSFNVLEVWK